MNARLYPALVGIWVLAAVVAVAGSLSRAAPTPEIELQALPLLAPGARAAASFETDDTLPSGLSGVAVEAVRGSWTGPGGRPFFVAVRSRSESEYRHRPFGRESFYLALRLPEPTLAREACTSCHEGQRIVDGRAPEDEQRVHQNIQPVHPAESGGQCRTCHVAADVGQLRLESGSTASMDHAYRLCTQCHFRQVESWATGAHGKRLVGWRGRRVVMGCADCHDPHRPATIARIPMAGVTLPGVLSGEGGGESHD